jgi:hypothetical protein
MAFRLLARLFSPFRKRCPRCGERAVRMRNWIRATCVDEQGKRYPDAWAYCCCDACGDRTKRFMDGRVVTPSEKEWAQYVDAHHF